MEENKIEDRKAFMKRMTLQINIISQFLRYLIYTL